ncbi:MAG TPA: polyprenyl synthetase family protein [Candidatus Portnoybacteria bacterium]|nr:polyprenyl synthetase family protein [Candidatus Portnoybacteria bacterium]
MDFEKTIKKYQKIINKEMDRYLRKTIKGLPNFKNSFILDQYRIFREYCLGDGKRLRPILTLMAYRAVGGKDEKKVVEPALAFELYHNYTLIHDDIYDEDDKRRGKASVHILFEQQFKKDKFNKIAENKLYKNFASRFGAVAGIINGKYLHTISSFPILESNISEAKKVAGMNLHQLVSIFDNTGQAMDLHFEQDEIVSEQDYYNMVLCKTGQLFKSAMAWGAILGDATESQKRALDAYIEEAAIVFQMQDDILDIDSDGGKGRGIGSDIRKGKKTLLVIHALKKANSSQRQQILSVLGKEKASAKEIGAVINLFKKLGSLDYCRQDAQTRLKRAIKYLDAAQPAFESEAKKFFCDLAGFMLERKK